MVFQQLLQDQDAADNAAAYAGLGESDFARGDYRAAVNDFSAALRLNPRRPGRRPERWICPTGCWRWIPTRRGLDAAERLPQEPGAAGDDGERGGVVFLFAGGG